MHPLSGTEEMTETDEGNEKETEAGTKAEIETETEVETETGTDGTPKMTNLEIVTETIDAPETGIG